MAAMAAAAATESVWKNKPFWLKVYVLDILIGKIQHHPSRITCLDNDLSNHPLSFILKLTNSIFGWEEMRGRGQWKFRLANGTELWFNLVTWMEWFPLFKREWREAGESFCFRSISDGTLNTFTHVAYIKSLMQHRNGLVWSGLVYWRLKVSAFITAIFTNAIYYQKKKKKQL